MSSRGRLALAWRLELVVVCRDGRGTLQYAMAIPDFADFFPRIDFHTVVGELYTRVCLVSEGCEAHVRES